MIQRHHNLSLKKIPDSIFVTRTIRITCQDLSDPQANKHLAYKLLLFYIPNCSIFRLDGIYMVLILKHLMKRMTINEERNDNSANF